LIDNFGQPIRVNLTTVGRPKSTVSTGVVEALVLVDGSGKDALPRPVLHPSSERRAEMVNAARYERFDRLNILGAPDAR
jgi:hypothetical protein